MSEMPKFLQDVTALSLDKYVGKWYVVLRDYCLFLSRTGLAYPQGQEVDGSFDHYYFDTREAAELAYASWLLSGCPESDR